MKDKLTWEEAIINLKQKPDCLELVCDCFYDDPLSECAKRYYQSSEWKEIQNIISKLPQGKALDIGAGRGVSSFALVKDGWEVTALEPDKSDVVGAGAIRKLAFEEHIKINVVEAYGEDLPFEDNSFDLVYARAVLHHAKNIENILAEISRVLRPKGMFMATREHVINNKRDLSKFYSMHPLHELYGGENAYPLKCYISKIRESGIKLEKVLRPFDSNINLFPRTKEGLRETVAQKTKLFVPMEIFNAILRFMSIFYNKPGRLYSFIGIKR